MVVGFAAGALAFVGFRSVTVPTALSHSPLQLFLGAGFVLSGSFTALFFIWLCERLLTKARRLATLPLVMAFFVLASGLGVYVSTAICSELLRRRGLDAESQHHQYAATSGMQMTALDGGVFGHVILGAPLALLVLAIGGSIFATGRFEMGPATATSSNQAMQRTAPRSDQ